METNAQQDRLTNLPIGNVLVIAPAGCGKTEALATRAYGVLARGEVRAPRKILAITFSNKAKENLASRMRAVVGAGWHQRVSVTNFHGLAARVVKAHGTVVGVPADVSMPEDVWRNRERRKLGITFRNSDAFDAALGTAKSGPFDDDEVMDSIVASGHKAAIAYELRLREDRRLDHDDVIRHAARLLAIPEIGGLYRAHFAMVMVDEVQDLSLMQYDMVRAVGGDTVTYAGDPAQGIYSFAGADPVEVFKRIRDLDPEVVEFNRSYRSAPAVLGAVNALAGHMGITELECGDPDRWPDEGHVISLERNDTAQEASALVALIGDISKDPNLSIGVIGRRGSRFDALRAEAEGMGVAFEDWSLPTHVPRVVELIKRTVREAVSGGGSETATLDRLEYLCRELVEPADAETLNELAGACDALRGALADGQSVTEAVASCRSSPAPDAAVAPGLHLLTGHKGKGQEFDWVVVVGLEGGHIPDFRSETEAELAEELRVLHVMVSRARYGVVVTHSRKTPTKNGWRKAEPSPWLGLLRGAATTFDHQ